MEERLGETREEHLKQVGHDFAYRIGKEVGYLMPDFLIPIMVRLNIGGLQEKLISNVEISFREQRAFNEGAVRTIGMLPQTSRVELFNRVNKVLSEKERGKNRWQR